MNLDDIFLPINQPVSTNYQYIIRMTDGTLITYQKSTINPDDYVSQTIGLLLYYYGLVGGDIDDLPLEKVKLIMQNLFLNETIFSRTIGRIVNSSRKKSVSIQRNGLVYFRFHSIEDYKWGFWFLYKSWYNEPIVIQWNESEPIGPHTKDELEKVLLEMDPKSIFDFFFVQRVSLKREGPQ